MSCIVVRYIWLYIWLHMLYMSQSYSFAILTIISVPTNKCLFWINLCFLFFIFIFKDVVVHALDTTWELHKPYLQKSSLLTSLLRKAEMTGMRNIEEEDEEDMHKASETGVLSFVILKVHCSLLEYFMEYFIVLINFVEATFDCFLKC